MPRTRYLRIVWVTATFGPLVVLSGAGGTAGWLSPSARAAANTKISPTPAQPPAHAASKKLMRMYLEADKAIHVWQDEANAGAENFRGNEQDCREANGDVSGVRLDWAYVENDGKTTKGWVDYSKNLFRQYEHAITKLFTALAHRWPRDSAKWGRVMHAGGQVHAALTQYDQGMEHIRKAGGRFIAHDCRGARNAANEANAFFRNGLHKLSNGMKAFKQLAQEA